MKIALSITSLVYATVDFYKSVAGLSLSPFQEGNKSIGVRTKVRGFSRHSLQSIGRLGIIQHGVIQAREGDSLYLNHRSICPASSVQVILRTRT